MEVNKRIVELITVSVSVSAKAGYGFKHQKEFVDFIDE